MENKKNKKIKLANKTIIGEILLIGSTLGLKTCLFGGLGIIGAFISKMFGGWD